MPTTRQLAAILFADIQGYTALMQDDEVKAIIVRDKFQKALTNEIKPHNGRIIQLNGDGALCIFKSAIEAIRAAIEIQKQMRGEPSVPLRIGIHSGDVVTEGKNVYGDGVNVASRIESFAVPGSVFISGKVYDEIRNHKDIEAVSLGKFELKNVSEPMEIFAISNAGLIVPKKEKLEGKGKGKKTSTSRRWLLPVGFLIVLLSVAAYLKFFSASPVIDKSIAVLPFVDMSANHDQEYFGDGLSEELLDHLSQIPELKVISRTSSFSFKGKEIDLRVIGEKLGVAHILEGSVRKDKNKIRITAQLIKARDGTHLWSETYDRNLDDIFNVQDEISRAVVQQLKATILNDTTVKSLKRNPEAYNLMLQGKYFLALGDDESIIKGIGFFNQGLALDSDNAQLRASLANAWQNMAGSEYISMTEGIAKARAEAERAIALDDHLPDGYLARGRIKQVYDWDWMGAEADYQKAFELDPENANVIHRKASLARTLGKFDEAISLFHKAINTDPVNTGHYSSLGIALVNARQFEEAKRQFRKVLELNPDYRSTHIFIGCIYIFQEKPDSALMEIQHETDETWRACYLPLANYANGRKAEADKGLQDFIAQHQVDWSYQIAQNYAWRGDADKTFYWLERAYIQSDSGLPEMYGDPIFDKIKNDPRYLVFMKKMKLM